MSDFMTSMSDFTTTRGWAGFTSIWDNARKKEEKGEQAFVTLTQDEVERLSKSWRTRKAAGSIVSLPILALGISICVGLFKSLSSDHFMHPGEYVAMSLFAMRVPVAISCVFSTSVASDVCFGSEYMLKHNKRPIKKIPGLLPAVPKNDLPVRFALPALTG